MQKNMLSKYFLVMVAVLAVAGLSALGVRASGGYLQTNLVSNQAGMAAFTDPNLINPWGVSFQPGGPFWVSDNGSGKSTLYSGINGQPQSLIVPIPSANGIGNGTPTGQVSNVTSGFVVTSGGHAGAALFIFATNDGTISGWNPAVSNSAVIAINNSSLNANYMGLAMATVSGKSFIYAANFFSGKVEVYDSTFTQAGTFTDSKLTGYAPFGIQFLDNKFIVVAFAQQNAQKNFPNIGAGLGVVDIFTPAGKLVRREVVQGHLNAPWGLALAPSNFGTLSGDLLVGNLGDGTINAYNPSTGAFVSQMMDGSGNVISIDGLWALYFGGGGESGPTNSLFFTAGPNFYANGLFGTLTAQ
jgi:uncharacterized protein (TIGR03118 family)